MLFRDRNRDLDMTVVVVYKRGFHCKLTGEESLGSVQFLGGSQQSRSLGLVWILSNGLERAVLG